MSDRTRWTKPQLQRMIALKQSGMTNQEIFQTMKQEFGRPQTIGEINTELHFLNKGPRDDKWNPAMDQRVKQLYDQGMDSKDITTELFHEFAKPDMWQETYRKIQQMKLQGLIG
ncbi:MAG: hypothetical protein Q9184_007172 [Pyrenodesmia sp. 2 TL-2023]